MFGKNKNDKKINSDDASDVKIHTMQDDLSGYIEDMNEENNTSIPTETKEAGIKDNSPFSSISQSYEPEIEPEEKEIKAPEKTPPIELKKMDGFSGGLKKEKESYSNFSQEKPFNADEEKAQQESSFVDAVPMMPKSVDNITTAVENKDDSRGFASIVDSYKTDTAKNDFIDNISDESAELEDGNKGIKSLIFVIIAIILILALGVGGYFVWNSGYKEDITDAISKSSDIFTEEPVIIVEEDDNKSDLENANFSDEVNFLTINSSEINKESLDALFSKTLLDMDGYSGNLLEFILVDENNNPIAFSYFAQSFGINLSQNSSAYLKDNFSLYFHKNGSIKKMGIAVEVSDGDLLRVNLKNEELILADNVKALFMGESVDYQKGDFSSSIYNGIDVRFNNLDDFNSVDYAITGEYLMIATSKDSGRAILDKILMSGTAGVSAVEGMETVSDNIGETKNIFDENLLGDNSVAEGETIIRTE